MAPGLSVRLLLMVSSPTGLPGIKVPPLFTVTEPRMKPEPPSLPELLTVTLPEPVPLPARLLSRRVPALMVTGPVKVLLPDKAKVLEPERVRLPEPEMEPGMAAVVEPALARR